MLLRRHLPAGCPLGYIIQEKISSWEAVLSLESRPFIEKGNCLTGYPSNLFFILLKFLSRRNDNVRALVGSAAHKSRRLKIQKDLLLTESLIVTVHQVLVFIFAQYYLMQFKQYCKIKTLSNNQNIIGVRHVVVMTDIETNYKGLCENYYIF